MTPAPVDRTASSGSPLVRVAGVTKSFGGVKALRGVSLEVKAGEVHALLGENGAGKSKATGAPSISIAPLSKLCTVDTVVRQNVGVLYVTHRLNEVFRISHRVTVLRDGANVGAFKTAETDMKTLVAAIVGPKHTTAEAKEKLEEEAPPEPRPATRPGGGELVALAGVANDRLHGVDLSLMEGEIHGLAGLIGSGRTEILETIFALRPIARGELRLDGVAQAMRGPADAIEKGVALVPEDRQLQGLVLDHSIERNFSLPRLPYFSWGAWMRRGAETAETEKAISDLSIKTPGPSTRVRNLSGGNQQKVVFAKWNNARTRILLLDEPTVGVDVGAREEIYGLIREAASGGAGVLIVSSDLSELILLCDRISVVADGRVIATLRHDEFGDAEHLHQFIQISQSGQRQAA